VRVPSEAMVCRGILAALPEIRLARDLAANYRLRSRGAGVSLTSLRCQAFGQYPIVPVQVSLQVATGLLNALVQTPTIVPLPDAPANRPVPPVIV
jgi:hypothetical protein